MAQAKLHDEVKAFVVQAVACFDPPSEVVRAVKAEFALELTRQAVEAYDPTKRAGRALAARWRTLFDETRKAFLADTAAIAIAHRSVRLRALQRMATKAEEMRNLPLAAQLLEQAAKEVGNAFTNKRELTGAGGGPVQTEVVKPDLGDLGQDERDALRAILERRAGGPGGGPPGA